MNKKIRNRMIVLSVLLGLVIGVFTIGNILFRKGTKGDPVVEIRKHADSEDRRIAAYMKKHAEISKTEAAKRVRMNLDRKPYTHVKEVKDLDSMTILVNKYNRLPSDYEPKDLVEVTNSGENEAKMKKEAAEHFEKLVDAAGKENIELSACSAYRSYSYQKNLYDQGVETNGKTYADAYWTRPGYSEHQSGLAVDIRLDGDTGDLDAPRSSRNYPWLKENIYKYGFIIRYPDKKKQYTLIESESWHLRYVGKDLAGYLYKNNLTLDEYYGRKE